MPTPASNQVRHSALIEEVRTAIYLIRQGLVSLNELSGANDFAHLPILLLSNGFERLLKMVICLDHLERNHSLPTQSSFRRHEHHRVTELLKEVIELAKRWDHGMSRAATRDDIAFLENDEDLHRIVALLQKYADAGRYYHIDVILGKARSPEDNPVQLFESYSMEVLSRKPNCQDMIRGNNPAEALESTISYINKEVTILLQRFARALSRMFTLGELGQIGKRMTGIIGVFLFLQDQDLGTVRSLSRNDSNRMP